MTVLFADLVGSTAQADRRDPEDVRATLVPFYQRMRAELEHFGGRVEEFIGDAVMALFGAPVAHEDDPERGVRAALAIRDAIAELNEQRGPELSVRVSVATGEAVIDLRARPEVGEGMAAGDIVNTGDEIVEILHQGVGHWPADVEVEVQELSTRGLDHRLHELIEASRIVTSSPVTSRRP